MEEIIDLNPQFERAFELMDKTMQNLFVTGRAGTGKSTLLEYFRHKTDKEIVVLAPTGVAALNVGGETIHSFFHFKIGVTPSQIRKVRNNEIYKNIDTLVIDEISMVRADLLDCIDVFMRKNGKVKNMPFGGIQLIFLGDLYQLPPVVMRDEQEMFRTHYKSPYFFDAFSFHVDAFSCLELKQVYRQSQSKFVKILNAIRSDSLNERDLQILNTRVGADLRHTGAKYAIHLTTTNKMADKINDYHIKRLMSEELKLPAVTEGEISQKFYPTAHDLRLKEGAQVMMLNNDISGRWVNGSLAEVIGFEYDYERQCHVVGIMLEDGTVEDVLPHKWEIFKYTYDNEKKNVHAEPVGIFVQYPLKLAWAVTIHKSQGKTFDNVYVDFGYGTFAHGQAYVALSRCRSLEGLSLKKHVDRSHVKMDKRIVDFLSRVQ